MEQASLSFPNQIKESRKQLLLLWTSSMVLMECNYLMFSNKLIKLVIVLAVVLTLMFYSTVASEVISTLTFAVSIRADKYMVSESLICLSLTTQRLQYI